MAYGFKADPIVFGKDFVLGGYGSLGGEILREDGDWSDFVPVDEIQKLSNGDPQACTIFGTLNCVETLIDAKYGSGYNYSDRWLAWNSGTDRTGNTPQKVAETLRKAGVPFQSFWDVTPEVTTFESFYKNPPPTLFEAARTDFLYIWDFKHEYVQPTKQDILKALQYSPVGIGVTAWYENRDGIYYSPKGTINNHWVMCYGYDASKDAFKVFDSYDATHKFYKADALIEQAKRYSIEKRTEALTWWDKLMLQFSL